MIGAPIFPYTKHMNQCGVCDQHLRKPKVMAYYVVDGCGAIQYPVCAACAPYALHGHSPEQLRLLDIKMEKRAVECGLAKPQHGGGHD